MSDLTPNLWQLQAQGDSKGLIDALQNPSPDLRRRAAAALRVLGAVEALPALRRALKNESDPDTRTHLQLVLDDLLADRKVAEAEQASETRQFVAQLKSSDPAIAIKAARALGKLNDKTAVEALVLTFHNALLPAEVRLAAAEALIDLESAPAIVTLAAALQNPQWHVRRNAAAVLGQLRADWAVAPLAECLSDDHEIVRRTAHAALLRIGTQQAKDALNAFLRAPEKRSTGTLPIFNPLAAPSRQVSPDKAVTQVSPAVVLPPKSPDDDDVPPVADSPDSDSSTS